MKLIKKNEGFVCLHCEQSVPPTARGSSRNHCPFCLYSLHVDNIPGDRKVQCFGLMKPVGLRKYKQSWKILHQCERCGKEQFNIIADDDDMKVFSEIGVHDFPN